MILVQMVRECVRLHGLAAFLGWADEYTICDVHLDQMAEPVWDIGDALVLHVDCVVMGRLAVGNGTPISFLRWTPVRPFRSRRFASHNYSTEKLSKEYSTMPECEYFQCSPLQDY
jgi:hypothetical protein